MSTNTIANNFCLTHDHVCILREAMAVYLKDPTRTIYPEQLSNTGDEAVALAAMLSNPATLEAQSYTFGFAL